jgi:hypothetical protein
MRRVPILQIAEVMQKKISVLWYCYRSNNNEVHELAVIIDSKHASEQQK